ncbi:NADH dehydrogenase [ubiquinone] 1 alpha subcomplex subunit 11 isoform X1 [Pongo pygmaeus]|uniref:NADH dehydrogenase [ubiquinone] 1 alpha subcomplex subunit 11 isoform X1 n=1 Tax=Pongo pygmaeus TaxID=9600 RepID=UPI000CEFEBBE|nr:NADH dehydrogenase [ubiquinone] 1 alpha subcomplex subunit 11 isoform X1 [Pongo pygmaeus]
MAPKVFRQYWDIPDGTDCHRKAYSTTSIASVAGLTAAAYRVTLNPPGTFLEGVAKVGQYTFTADAGSERPRGSCCARLEAIALPVYPAAAVGAVFGLTTCISAQVREKPDDPLNYFLGGCAGGLTLGARTHNYGIGAAACVYLGIAASLVKMGQLEGWEVFVKPKV